MTFFFFVFREYLSQSFAFNSLRFIRFVVLYITIQSYVYISLVVIITRYFQRKVHTITGRQVNRIYNINLIKKKKKINILKIPRVDFTYRRSNFECSSTRRRDISLSSLVVLRIGGELQIIVSCLNPLLSPSTSQNERLNDGISPKCILTREIINNTGRNVKSGRWYLHHYKYERLVPLVSRIFEYKC